MDDNKCLLLKEMGAGVSLSLSRDGVHGESICSSSFSLIFDPFLREYGFNVVPVPFSREQHRSPLKEVSFSPYKRDTHDGSAISGQHGAIYTYYKGFQAPNGESSGTAGVVAGPAGFGSIYPIIADDFGSVSMGVTQSNTFPFRSDYGCFDWETSGYDEKWIGVSGLRIRWIYVWVGRLRTVLLSVPTPLFGAPKSSDPSSLQMATADYSQAGFPMESTPAAGPIGLLTAGLEDGVTDPFVSLGKGVIDASIVGQSSQPLRTMLGIATVRLEPWVSAHACWIGTIASWVSGDFPELRGLERTKGPHVGCKVTTAETSGFHTKPMPLTGYSGLLIYGYEVWQTVLGSPDPCVISYGGRVLGFRGAVGHAQANGGGVPGFWDPSLVKTDQVGTEYCAMEIAASTGVVVLLSMACGGFHSVGLRLGIVGRFLSCLRQVCCSVVKMSIVLVWTGVAGRSVGSCFG